MDVRVGEEALALTDELAPSPCPSRKPTRRLKALYL